MTPWGEGSEPFRNSWLYWSLLMKTSLKYRNDMPSSWFIGEIASLKTKFRMAAAAVLNPKRDSFFKDNINHFIGKRPIAS